jgi:hypothetical protein
MKSQQPIEEQLWEYIDGTVAPKDRLRIEGLLQSQAEWKEKYNELLEISQLLQSTELESPSLRFSKNVMEEIARLQITPATKSYLNKKIIWGIGIFFLTMLVSILGYGFSQMVWTSNGKESISLSEQFSKLDASKFFNNDLINGFMMINVILGLLLLDNYLRNKRKEFRKEA